MDTADLNENIGPEAHFPDLEQPWQFGAPPDSRDFNTAIAHFYRGEVSRSTAWRVRLDATTNWAVIITGASLTFAFGSALNSPAVLIISTMLVMIFLFIEARRYRYYELWILRVRAIEQNYFAPLFSPSIAPQPEWTDRLTDSLNHPRFPISLIESVGRRYRRNYGPILLILSVSWIVKVYIHPFPADNLDEFMVRAAFGPIPGWLVILAGIAMQALLLAIGLLTVSPASAEVIGEPAHGWRRLTELMRRASSEALETELPRINRFDRRKQMAYIISDHTEAIGKALMKELKRGVTLLHGTGMYTGKEHGILLCALEARQMRFLRQAVQEIDPRAFIIVTPVQDVHGTGFRPLET